MRALLVAWLLVLPAALLAEEGEVSKERILEARRVPMEEYYVFTPRQAVSLEAAEPPVVDGRLEEAWWRAAEPLSDFVLTESGGPPSQRTEVFLRHHGGVLYVGFRAHEQAMARRRRPQDTEVTDGAWEGRADNLQLYFSTTNDHTRYYRLLIDIRGRTRLFVGYRLRGELPTDVMEREQELFRGPSLAYEVTDEEEAWTGEVAIPASALDLQGDVAGQVWGFNVVRVRMPYPREVSAWSYDPQRPGTFPIDFGDLLIGPRPVTVSKIDLGKPFWGENSAALTVTNRTTVGRKLRLLSSVYLPVEEVTYHRSETTEEVAGGQTRTIRLPYRLSWRGRWPIYAEYSQRLTLRVEDAETGEVLYGASYPVAFDVGVKPNERYGQAPDAPDPDPEDPDFLEKKRRYIIGRIPEFRRLTTAQGAESDFVLAAADGSVRFNLMEEGAVERIADWLYGLFDTDTDRMLAATLFLHQRTVTRHSGSLSRLGQMTPLSVIRRGGGLCDSRAQTLAGVLSRMKQDSTGAPYRSRSLGLSGHVVCAVEAVPEPASEADYWVLDPDVGAFYFTLDNRRFATLGELRQDRRLSYRMNFNNVRHSHEFYFNTTHQFTYGWEHKRVWPPGAPAW